MIIEGPFYRIVPLDDSASRYDFYLLKSIGGKNPRKEFKVESYSVPLDYIIRRIINFATVNKFKEDQIITLKEFLNEYRSTKDEILKDLDIRKE